MIIRISVSSNNHTLADSQMQLLRKYLLIQIKGYNRTPLNHASIIKFSQKKASMSLVRSPHVFKKSRETFKNVSYVTVLSLFVGATHSAIVHAQIHAIALFSAIQLLAGSSVLNITLKISGEVFA